MLWSNLWVALHATWISMNRSQKTIYIRKKSIRYILNKYATFFILIACALITTLAINLNFVSFLRCDVHRWKFLLIKKVAIHRTTRVMVNFPVLEQNYTMTWTNTIAYASFTVLPAGCFGHTILALNHPTSYYRQPTTAPKLQVNPWRPNVMRPFFPQIFLHIGLHICSKGTQSVWANLKPIVEWENQSQL